ncbi:MAG TPA: hypothetical protein VGF36_12775, partial [Rhodopila sp.]
MPLSGSRRMEALAGHAPRRRPWRIRLAALISLLVHVAIGLLLLLTIPREPTSEQLPPPSEVTMLFDSGRKSGPTLPNPSLQATPSAPPATEAPAPVTPLTQVVPTPAPPAPPATPPPPPAPEPAKPAPSVEASPVPAPPPPAPVEAPPPVEAPSPATVAPPRAEQAPLPLPPPLVKPLPAPKPSPPLARPSPAPKPLPARPPARRITPPNSSAFPAPMDFSFGRPNAAPRSVARSRSTVHIPGTIDMSLGPASRGKTDITPLSEHDAEAAGADWANALSRWVANHAYYPDEAARNLDEGDAKVRVRADPDGRVREVEL